jgi:TrpR family transcriptional regulator, trp operon repressor
MKLENNEGGWLDFLELCSKIKNPENFNRFFELFLTIEERENIASRYLIIKALLEGKITQRELAETHKVSIAQITRGSNALKTIDSEFKKFLIQKIEFE